MKKYWMILLAVLLCIGLCACGEPKEPSEETQDTQGETQGDTQADTTGSSKPTDVPEGTQPGDSTTAPGQQVVPEQETTQPEKTEDVTCGPGVPEAETNPSQQETTAPTEPETEQPTEPKEEGGGFDERPSTPTEPEEEVTGPSQEQETPPQEETTTPTQPEEEEVPPAEPEQDPEETDPPADDDDITYQDYIAMTTEEQLAFRATFPSNNAFKKWYLEAKEAYENNQEHIVIGPGSGVDIGDYIDP